MREAASGGGKTSTILAVAGRVAGLDQVGLYALMLAQRTGMNACLLLILTKEEESSAKTNQDAIKKKFQELQELGAESAVAVNCLVTRGDFAGEVVNYLQAHEIAIVVVSEGVQPKKRTRELREIKRRLALAPGREAASPRQFLLVAKMEEGRKPAPLAAKPLSQKGN